MKNTLFVLCAALFCLPLAYPQNSSEVIGTATDPSGAPVQGAKVTVIEMATGLSRSTVSSSEGFYTIPALRPSLYRTTVEASGFRTSTIENIRLEADQKATVNVKLEIGAITETFSLHGSRLLQLHPLTSPILHLPINDHT